MEKTYTEAEYNDGVNSAIKFVNECNARQFEIIQKLRAEIATLKGETDANRTVKNISEESNRGQSAQRTTIGPMDFVPVAGIRNIST